MPKHSTKLKLSSLNRTASKSAPSAKSGTASGKATAIEEELKVRRSPLLPGGVLVWCLVGLAIGLSVWLGGRTYLKRMLADQLHSASSEEVALQSIDALLRLDANATIEVSRGLAHPEFMVANAAFRALGGQLDAWTKLEPADRLLRMQKVVAELERMPPDIDQDHRILVSGLASRIYADTLSSREAGAGDVLEACRRILARTDPQHVPARIARLNANTEPVPLSTRAMDSMRSTESSRATEEVSPVPPPLAPLEPSANDNSSSIQNESSNLSDNVSDQVQIVPSRRGSMARMSLSDAPEPQSETPPARMHLTSGSVSIPQNGSISRTANAPMTTMKSPQAVDPLSASASSRSRVIPQNVEPLPGDTELPAATLSGMEQLAIDQLVRLLASDQPRVSTAATLLLRQRGMSEDNIDLAIQLANGSTADRQALLSQLVQRDELDARPWLLWMAADGEVVVRQQAIGLLKPIADNDVRRQLRLLLNNERDEKVAQTIRQVLMK